MKVRHMFSSASLTHFFNKVKNQRKPNLVLHGLGLSSLGAALFLEILVLTGIAQHDYFVGSENNLAILALELFLTFFGMAYFAYMLSHLILWSSE